MTQLSILGPPRGGRRVKSKEEFFAEVRSWQESSKSDPDLLPVDSSSPRTTRKPRSKPQPVVVPMPSIVPSYFVAPGRFAVGGITKQGNDYIFHDLELPMGCWKELTLYGGLLPDGPKSFDDWSKVAEVSQPVGVMPADVRYGLMAVCYLNNGKPGLRDIIGELHSGVWLPDANSNYPHNSTRLEYRANDSAVILPGVGWLSDHPFGVQYEANIAGPASEISGAAVSVAPSVRSALEGLLGENDPGRCKLVLEWGIGAKPAKLWRLGTVGSGERVVVFGVSGGVAGIISDDVVYILRSARAIRANKQDYIPK